MTNTNYNGNKRQGNKIALSKVIGQNDRRDNINKVANQYIKIKYTIGKMYSILDGDKCKTEGENLKEGQIN